MTLSPGENYACGAQDTSAQATPTDGAGTGSKGTPMPDPLPLHRRPCPACGETLNPGGNPYFSFDPLAMPDGSDCPDCAGTGYQFPMLGRECPYRFQHRDGKCPGLQGSLDMSRPRETCNGTGRIADYTVAALLEAAGSLPFEIKVEVHGRVFHMLTPKPEYPMTALSRWFNLPASERISYLKAALEAATEDNNDS